MNMNIRMLMLLSSLAFTACVSQQKYNKAVDAQARMNLLRQQYKSSNEDLRAEVEALKADTLRLAHAQREVRQQYEQQAVARSLPPAAEHKDSVHAGEVDLLTPKTVEFGQERGARLNYGGRVQNTAVNHTALERLQRKEEITHQLVQQFAQALTDFEPTELSIHQRNEEIVITLHHALLFQQGALNQSLRSQAAIARIAQLLKEEPRLQLRVEGHTARVPGTADSWERSFQLALSVAQEILENPGIAASRMAIVARGDQHPLLDEAYPMAAQLNQRVEIVLEVDEE